MQISTFDLCYNTLANATTDAFHLIINNLRVASVKVIICCSCRGLKAVNKLAGCGIEF